MRTSFGGVPQVRAEDAAASAAAHGDSPAAPASQSDGATTGASAPWSERLNRRLLTLDRSQALAMRMRVEQASLPAGLWLECEGRQQALAVVIRPRLLDLSRRGYVHHAAWQVRMGLRRLAHLATIDPVAASLFPLEEAEQEWLERYRCQDRRYGTALAERVFCRLDAVGTLEGSQWRDSLRFLETNVVGIGGMSYAPAAERVVLDCVLPSIVDDADDMDFDVNADPRDLLVDELVEHARLGGCRRRPTIALVDDTTRYRFGGECGRLPAYLSQCGFQVVYADPRALELSGDDVVAAGRRVDVVYRFLEIRDLAAMEAAGHRLAALHVAFRRGIVVPTVGGELEHKSAFEPLTDPAYRSYFAAETVRVCDEHVAWTRLLYDRKTTGPSGESIDLVRYVARRRTDFVIKPNRGAGGEGVVLGREVDQAAWEAALSDALHAPGSCVVQSYAPVTVELLPRIDDDGSVTLERRYCVVGFFPGRRGLGVFGRHAATGVVNIQAGGGIVPFLVAVR